MIGAAIETDSQHRVASHVKCVRDRASINPGVCTSVALDVGTSRQITSIHDLASSRKSVGMRPAVQLGAH